MIELKDYLLAYHKHPWHAEAYEGQEDDMNTIIEYNKALIAKYPWLEPTNAWSGKKIVACANGEKGFWPNEPDKLPKYNYEHTELDSMPEGWRIAFGEQLCEELQKELEKADLVDDYMITQIKEKYGGLRWYDSGATKEVYDILSKYETLSYKTCINCGKPAKWLTTGWISPYCDDCKEQLETEIHDTFRVIIPIDK